MDPLRRFSCRRVTLLGVTLLGVALRSVFLLGAGLGALALAAAPSAGARPDQTGTSHRHHVDPPFLSTRACPRDARPLGADAVAVGARIALDTESSRDRPQLISASLADSSFASARGGEVRHYCGRRVWQRTVVVTIQTAPLSAQRKPG